MSSSSYSFEVIASDPISRARAGVLRTPRGNIETPAYIPVGTQASVKGIPPRDLKELGAQVVLVNTYHMFLRPGVHAVEKLSGLHTLMGWDGPIITDSGGFQIFSFGSGAEQGVGKIAGIFPGERPSPRVSPHKNLVRVDEDGVTFTSYLDGSRKRLTPEISIESQERLGADILIAFDECTSPLDTYEYTKASMERSHRWEKRSLAAHKGTQALFGIIQGGAFRDLREESARVITSMSFDGLAVGGSLGRTKGHMKEILEWTVPLLPDFLPRHLLGIGEVEDLFFCIPRGIDLFDCSCPTRIGRKGTLFISPAAGGTPANRFRINIRNARFAGDSGAIDPTCSCYACRHFSRAYLRHLFMAHELLACYLGSFHNLHFMLGLARKIRKAICEGTLPSLMTEWGMMETTRA